MKRYCLSHFQTFRNYSFLSEWGLPGGTMVKNLPANAADTGYVGSFPGGGGAGEGDPLEKGMATHASILAWKIPRTEEPGGLQSMGLQRVRHN